MTANELPWFKTFTFSLQMSDMWTEKMLYNVSAYIYTNIFCSHLPCFYQVGSSAGSDQVPRSHPGKLVPKWHKLFAGLEQRTAYVRSWGQSYYDQGPTKTVDNF